MRTILLTRVFISDSLMSIMKNKMAALTNLTHLLSHVFSSHFVFPVLGHDDPEPLSDAEEPYKDLAELWKQWLPSEALVTFRKGKLIICSVSLEIWKKFSTFGISE